MAVIIKDITQKWHNIGLVGSYIINIKNGKVYFMPFHVKIWAICRIISNLFTKATANRITVYVIVLN